MKKRTVQTLVLAMSTCWAVVSHATEWSYTGERGAEHWGDTFATCGEGVNQTPIDVNKAIKAELVPLHIDYQGSVKEIINNGHTIQANITGENTLTVDNEEFALKQFHFHTPSENYINGKQYPLEAHFVHANQQGQLAVIAVMFNTGPRANDQLNMLLEAIPKKDTATQLTSTFNPAELLPRDREYYRFNGSLTTPPCSEGVRWFMMKDHQSGSEKQVGSLHGVMGDNARPLQPLNARVILE
ncbi:carbonic anhydrase [Photobacterium minamisatsumaniensis]|uniref:carbonic anhydrase n=1 Tax=Photobacterium minamisatsumaniensis TaxID=2910233 RepID=UPI003D151A0B